MTGEQFAELLVEKLRPVIKAEVRAIAEELRRPQSCELVSAKEVAVRIGRTPKWVREHKHELGAVRMGDGERPRWGFDPVQVDQALDCRRLT